MGGVNDIAFSHPNKSLSIITCGDDKLIKVLCKVTWHCSILFEKLVKLPHIAVGRPQSLSRRPWLSVIRMETLSFITLYHKVLNRGWVLH